MMSTHVLSLMMMLMSVASKAPVEQCIDGMSGENCNIPCRTSCTTCDRVTGECTGSCRYQQYFGKLCNQICPVLCDGACDKTTGSCISCKPTYGGARCNNHCPTNCRKSCDMKTMECHLCKPGFTGKFCNEICPLGCSSCTQLNSTCIEPCPDEGTYGDECEEPCPENCMDGCYKDTGECVNCAEGFGGILCNQSCPENCSNGCDRYQGTCNDCRVGYSGRRCSEKCPANCKDKCDQKTRHCFGCLIGFHGEKCNENCTDKCNGGCHQTTAVCKACGTGLMGQYCNVSCDENCKECEQITGECMKCKVGFTGVFCDHTCSHYCIDECDQTLGECIGCIDRYTGEFCNATCPTDCLRNCDQYTGECDMNITENMMVKISLGVAVIVVGILFIVLLSKRRQMRLNRNRRARLDVIPEENDDRDRNSTGHRYYEIDDNSLVNKREMVTARSNNLPHQHVSLPPPLPSQRIPQRSPPSQQDVNLRLPLPLPTQKPQEKQNVDLQLPPPLPNQRLAPLIPLTQQDLDGWSPAQAKTTRPKTDRSLSTFGRNQTVCYLDAIFESNINSASTFTGHRYDDIDENNLVEDSRRIVTARRDDRLPSPLLSPQITLPNQDIQLPPSVVRKRNLPFIGLCLHPPLPRQRGPPERPPLQQDVDLELHNHLPCKQNQVQPPRPRKVNYHFDCDVIFENAIYESADEVLFPHKEIVPPMAERKENPILLEEELEHLKHPVAVGGAPVVAYPVIEVVPIPDIVTDDDGDNFVSEILETSV